MDTRHKFYEKIKDLCKDVEFFMIESPANHYIPSPPEGFIGIRSHKRRLFVPMNCLKDQTILQKSINDACVAGGITL